MKKFFYDEDIDEEEEDLGSEERLNLDNPEEVDNGDGFEQTVDHFSAEIHGSDGPRIMVFREQKKCGASKEQCGGKAENQLRVLG